MPCLRIQHNGTEFRGLLAVAYCDHGYPYTAQLPVIRGSSLHELFRQAHMLHYKLDLNSVGLQLAHAVWKTALIQEISADYVTLMEGGGKPITIDKVRLHFAPMLHNEET
jgi:hypothetical protein